MKSLFISIICLLSLVFVTQAQTDTLRYFESYFETNNDRAQWTNVPSDNNKNWIFNSMGGYINLGDGLNYNPDAAYEGTYNAFHVWSDFNPDIRKIVSVPIDLSDSKKPELAFAHAMFESVFGSNTLAVLFKAGKSAPWDTIINYNTPIDEWTVHNLNIKDYGIKYLCKDFQVAFESQARGEFGVCIDSVVIEEKDIIVRYVKSLKVKHVIQNPLPSGSSDIPVMRIDIQVVGNTDPIDLNSIIIQSLSSHDSLFANNGFELVATTDSSYRNALKSGASLKIGTSSGISGGTISFSGLNYHLSTGYNAIWLIADIKNTAPHYSIADFKINAGNILIGSKTFPAAEISPSGFNTIEESVFYDGFEGPNGWTIESDFETATPKGFTAYITRDPDCAYSGSKILGTDLTVDGKYEFNINASTAYYATSPAINLKYYNDVKLSFKKWIAFEGNDQGLIEVSIDNGATWQIIWDSKIEALTPDNDWVNFSLDEEFNAIAAHQAEVKIRFGVVFSDGNFAYAGFNIDNFAITGNYLTNDVGIVDIIRPVDDCHNPGMDTVMITIRNYADRETLASIPVFFSVDGTEESKILEYIPGPIAKDGTATFKFTQTANFPSPGNFDAFTVKLLVPGDEDGENDSKVKEIFIQKSLSPPDFETFETGGGYWKSYGSDPRWLCKIPEGSIPPVSGNSWISSPFGNYLTQDTSYLESSCYNLYSEDKLIVEMKLWIDSEPGIDGASLEYSTDEGTTWHLLPIHGYPWNWNWYNGPVTALGTSGWSGINSVNWKTVKQVIPVDLYTEPKVKFRLVWASDDDNTYRGMAIDEFKVYQAPMDIAVSSVDSFANRCQGLNPDEVTVNIKNMGINALRQNDTIIVGFRFNEEHLATDTFKLAADLLPGAVTKYTFNKRIDVSSPGNYNITAFTLSEKDPWFYEGNNDTLSIDFEVYPGPVTTLIDTIQTHLPDTVILETYYHADYDYWWNGESGTATYQVEDDGWQHLTVTATRGNGCSSYDSTNVELLFYDVGAQSLVHPVNDCGFSKHEFPVVRIANFGTDSIVAGQKIAVSYHLNSGEAVSDTIKLSATLYSGKAVDFTFTKGQLDLSEQGIYNFKIYTSYGGDTIAMNDTIFVGIEILGRPVVSLGPDVTVEALSHVLDAGSGYTGYIWDNNTTEQSREVTESGYYWVKVTDNNGCDNSDTAYVRLKIRDIHPESFVSPQSGCDFNSSTPVTLRIYNSGTDTVPAGSAVTVSYQFGSGLRVNHVMNLAGQLIPGAFTLFTFPGTLDLSVAGDYNLEAAAVLPGDLRTGNDTLVTTLYEYAKPVVDFGLASTEYIEDVSYMLDAGYSEFYTYQWQDTTTTHTYNVTSDGLYYVKATDSRTSCFDRDTVRVFLIYSDVGVTWTDMQESGCAGVFDNVKVRVTNLGPSSIGSSAPIYIACEVNGIRVTVDTLIRTGNFNPGASLDLPLSGSIAIENEGNSAIALYTLYESDKKSENDSLYIDFQALAKPVIDFGDDNGVLNNVELPHVLDAGAGHQSYEWQDNTTNQTYTVNTAGVYSVTVIGQNDCQATKTVSINMQSGVAQGEALKFSVYPNPNSGRFRIRMEGHGDEELTVRIISNQGQVVYVRDMTSGMLNEEQIDVSHLSRGLYHLTIQGKKFLSTVKMVIE